MSTSEPATADTRDATEQWYRNYYEKKGASRNDVLRNPGVTLQYFAQKRAIMGALQFVKAELTWRVLDVGCGSGAGLCDLLSLGFSPENLHGIDLVPERAAEAQHRLPHCKVIAGDASQMSMYSSRMFDLAFASTMFMQITVEELAGKIAAEMQRVVRTGGFLILSDWRYDLGNPRYRALDKRRIKGLFGAQARPVARFSGPLVPPIGRFLSARMPSLYDPVRRCFPFLVGQMTTVLRIS